jgi:DNA-binding transcriptional MerR regulator
MRTSELAKLFAVHPNTVRLYEEWGYLPPIPRDQSGRREFTEQHVEQMRLARAALHDAPRSSPQFKEVYKELVWLACSGQIALAITQARKHLATIKTAQEQARNAMTFLQAALPETIAQLANPPLSIQQAASFMGISVPILRRWEDFGLLQVPRNPKNKYRMYGNDEIGWLLVIQSLRQAGHNMVSCKQLIDAVHSGSDSSSSGNLCDAIGESIALFIDHDVHTNKILDQLHRMTPSA